MSCGFIVPVQALPDNEACMSLGGELRDLNIRSEPAIHLVAMYAYARRLLPCRFANV
jgi:LuxR family quorum sensing-dependent transcriptional regulator